MADFNATFAPHNKCVLLNTGGTFGLCTKEENRHNNSLRRLEKDRKRRARKTRTAGECGPRHARNALTSGHCGGCR
jgi:hypothetical protein